MELKHCKNCTRDLPATNIYFASRYDRKTPQLQGICKECQTKYRKEHYERNKIKYINKARTYTKKVAEWFTKEVKDKLTCSKCGENRHWVLDFHHLDPETKEDNVSNLLAKGSKKKLLKEIEKCIVLCSNCHRDLHYQEKQASEVLR